MAARIRSTRKCFSTALWVAFWGFAAAAGLGGADVNAGVAYAIASSAGAIGVTAIICGTVLAAREHQSAMMQTTIPSSRPKTPMPSTLFPAGVDSDSAPTMLNRSVEPKWRNGRRAGLKIRSSQEGVGSSPTFGTIERPSGIVAAIPSGRFDLLFNNDAEVDLRLEPVEH